MIILKISTMIYNIIRPKTLRNVKVNIQSYILMHTDKRLYYKSYLIIRKIGICVITIWLSQRSQKIKLTDERLHIHTHSATAKNAFNSYSVNETCWYFQHHLCNVEESPPFLSFTRLFEAKKERKRDVHRIHSQWVKMRLYLFVVQPVEPSSVRQQEVHTSLNVCQSKHRPLLIFKRNHLMNKRWTYQT